MGVTIEHNPTRSTTTSVASVSDEDDHHDTDAYLSPTETSPELNHVNSVTSQSGSSSHAGDYIHLPHPSPLPYPAELNDERVRREVRALDPAARFEHHERPQNSRTHSLRREAVPRRQLASAYNPPRSRPRSEVRTHHEASPTESGDSAEDFILDSEYAHSMPRPQSYYGHNGYPQSNSSTGSYGYPPVHPPSNQVIHYAHQGQQGSMHPHYAHHGHHHHQYPPVSSPSAGYGPAPGHHPSLQYSAPAHYASSPYGPPTVIQQNPYGPPPQGYFPGGYPQYPTGYPQPHPYPHQAIPPLPAYIDQWRVSPHPGNASAVSSSSSEKPAIDQEELLKQMKLLMASSNAEREAREKERQASIKTAEDQAAAMRKAEKERQAEEAFIRQEALRNAREAAEIADRARADRAADEARIRREATEAAEKAIAAAAAAAAEQAAREAKIREEAAKAALEAAAAEAKARAEQEAREKKIAAEARESATSEAEKKAAEDAQKAEEAAKAAKEESDKKVKEAEEAAAKAKAEAEVAQAKADAATPAEKKPPIRFKDAIGRNYNFPWERCHKWRDMEGLIIQAFQHIADLGDHVLARHYDLIGPDEEIIMPEYWDVTIQPDMAITMKLWPLPEKPLEPPPITDIPGIIDLDDLLNPKKKPAKKKPAKGGFSSWMMGGTSKTKKGAKEPKTK